MAKQSVELSPKVSGRLAEVLKDAGDAVSQGEVVAVIDKNDFSAAFEEAKASVEAAKAAVKQAEVARKSAEDDLARKEELFAFKAISKKEMEEAQNRVETEKARLMQADAALKQAKQKEEQARLNLAETEIKSPFEGEVSYRYFSIGAFVSPQTPVFGIMDRKPVILRFSAPEDMYGVLVKGAAVEFTCGAVKKEFNEKIARTSPLIDRSSRMFFSEVEYPNEDLILAPGMACEIRIR